MRRIRKPGAFTCRFPSNLEKMILTAEWCQQTEECKTEHKEKPQRMLWAKDHTGFSNPEQASQGDVHGLLGR